MAAPLVPLDVLHSISLETWHRLFAAYGYPSDLACDAKDHEIVGATLDPPPWTTKLARAHPPLLLARMTVVRSDRGAGAGPAAMQSLEGQVTGLKVLLDAAVARLESLDALKTDVTAIANRLSALDRLEKATTLNVHRVVNRWAGLRSFVRDRSPCVGFDSRQPGFFWMAALGGYGIQTAPALSRLAAALFLGRDPDGVVAQTAVDPAAISPERL